MPITRKPIKKSSFRSNIIEAVIQFCELEKQEEDTSEDRTAEEWWDEFKTYMEGDL